MRKVKLLVDKEINKSKPLGNKVAQIQVRLREEKSIVDITIEELVDYIKKGYTFVPGVTRGGNKVENK